MSSAMCMGEDGQAQSIRSHQNYTLDPSKFRCYNSKVLAHVVHDFLGLLDGELLAALMEGLVEAMRHTSSVATSSKSLAMKTELMHSLLAWTRATEVGYIKIIPNFGSFLLGEFCRCLLHKCIGYCS